MQVHPIGNHRFIRDVEPGTLVAFGAEGFGDGVASRFGIKISEESGRVGSRVFLLEPPSQPRGWSLIEVSSVFAYVGAVAVPSTDRTQLFPRAPDGVPVLSLAIQADGTTQVVGQSAYGSGLYVNLSDGSIDDQVPRNVSIILKWQVRLPMPFGESVLLAEFGSP